MNRPKAPDTPPTPFVERRRDSFTRAIVSGLQKMTADLEKLPEGPARVAALAAVDQFAHCLADALERRKRP